MPEHILDTSRTMMVLRRAIKVFGYDAQWGQVMEECAELIVAISHHLRKRVDSCRSKVAEEVADVLLTAMQARQMIGKDLVDTILATKIQRLSRRLDHEEQRRAEGLEPQGDTGEIK